MGRMDILLLLFLLQIEQKRKEQEMKEALEVALRELRKYSNLAIDPDG